MTTRVGDSNTSSAKAAKDSIAKTEHISFRHGAVKRQAAHIDDAGDEAKNVSDHSLNCTNTAPVVTQNPPYFDVSHIPMVCGKWNAHCNADRAGINPPAKLPATEGTAILDTVPKEDQRQSVSWEHDGGIDLDAYLPEIPSAECLHYEALWKEAGRKQEAADARCLNDMFGPPIEDGAIKPCSDAQLATTPEYTNKSGGIQYNSFTGQFDPNHGIPLPAGLREKSSNERTPQSEIDDSDAIDHVFRDWALIEKHDAQYGSGEQSSERK